jgi:putative ABC transport system permease protein
MKSLTLVWKNLRRNKLRTALTTLAVVALVAIFSMIATVLLFLDDLVSEKSKDLNILITDRYKLMMPFDRRHMDAIVTPGTALNEELRQVRGFHPEKYTIWHIAAFTLDPEMKSADLAFFVAATIPEKIESMTEGLEGFDPAWVGLMKDPPRSHLANAGMVLGAKRLKKLGKQVGDVFKAKGLMHRAGPGAEKRTSEDPGPGEPIVMEFEIVGVVPEGNRWDDAGFIDYAYLDRVLKAFKNVDDGKIHYGWLQVDDNASAARLGGTVERYIRDIKCETTATAYSRFMEPLNDILWGLKWILIPAILVVMTLILSNTFSITMRERQTEIAVLKVLGFSTGRILLIVLGEAVLIGALAGLAGSAVTVGLVNGLMGGVQIPQFPTMLVPYEGLAWGPVIGVFTAFAGGLWPALNARAVKVAQVFAAAT